MNIILASASPRRRELLSLAGYDFVIHPVDADESIPKDMQPTDAVCMLSQRKAQMAALNYPDDLVIGADTIVVLNNTIFGKPENEANARNMLSALSGKTHQVFTGVCLCIGQTTKTFYVCTDVTFYPLTEQEINNYIASKEPMDKAGAYGIQGKGCLLVEHIHGDYNNVVGLPVSRLSREITTFFSNQKESL